MTTTSNPKTNVQKAPHSDHTHPKDAVVTKGHPDESGASEAPGHGHQDDHNEVAAKTDKPAGSSLHGEAKESVHGPDHDPDHKESGGVGHGHPEEARHP